MHPFTASISLFAHPGILYSLWAADMQTKSQQAFGATWSNPIIWGRSRATSVPAWCGEKERKEWGSCGWQGERGGDTPKMGSLIPLACGQSLVWALCQVSFSSLDCRMDAFQGAVVTGRKEPAQPWVFLSTPTCTERLMDVTAVQRREGINRGDPIDLNKFLTLWPSPKEIFEAKPLHFLN